MLPRMQSTAGQTEKKKSPEMVLQILLWLGVAVLALVILLVTLPIRIMASWQSEPAKQATILLRPFGGISPPIKVYDSTRKQKRAGRKARKPKKKGRALRGNVLAEAVRLLRNVLGAFHFEALHLQVEFGLGDPAETGQLFGQLCPVIYGSGADVRLVPNFDKICLHGRALARVRVRPIAVVWPFVGFGWRVFGPGR